MGGKIAEAMLHPINQVGPFILGFYTFLWGFWVANPLWSVFSRAPLYDSMAVLAPEWVWGLLALFIGVAMLYGILSKHPTWMMLSAGGAAWVWATVAVFYFVADWMSTGGITSLMICVYSIFIYLNVRVNYYNQQPHKLLHRKGGS